MILLFKLIILSVICVLGFKIATEEGMLLEKIGKFFEKQVEEGKKVFDLFVCPWCMGTLFSLPAHGFAFLLGILPAEFNWQLVFRYPLVVMGCSIVSGLIWTGYLTINRIKDRNDIECKYLDHIEKMSYYDLKERKENYHRKNGSETGPKAQTKKR